MTYEESTKKFDELVEKYGYEKGKEEHSQWLKATTHKEEYNEWKSSLPSDEREQFEIAFGI
jgi:ribosome-interacting GTPase 1